MQNFQEKFKKSCQMQALKNSVPLKINRKRSWTLKRERRIENNSESDDSLPACHKTSLSRASVTEEIQENGVQPSISDKNNEVSLGPQVPNPAPTLVQNVQQPNQQQIYPPQQPQQVYPSSQQQFIDPNQQQPQPVYQTQQPPVVEASTAFPTLPTIFATHTFPTLPPHLLVLSQNKSI